MGEVVIKMKKKSLCVLLALVCAASCACGANAQGESTMETKNIDESNIEVLKVVKI